MFRSIQSDERYSLNNHLIANAMLLNQSICLRLPAFALPVAVISLCNQYLNGHRHLASHGDRGSWWVAVAYVYVAHEVELAFQ